ncbi:MAG: hypothetical protein ACI9J3_003783 [Parvicellaceae bacterium]|jgi:hypothetical protein
MHKYWQFLLLICAFSCSESNQVEAPFIPPIFDWEGNHILNYQIGDSISEIMLDNDSTDFGVITLASFGEETIEKLEATFIPNKLWGVDYSQIQNYYNQLFEGEEKDSTWSYWSFNLNDGIPRELYLIKVDTNLLEIKAYTASQF